MEEIVRKGKPRKCPNCGSLKIARIVYGLIDDLNPDLEKDLKEGKVVLGGCVIGEAKWECADCGNRGL
jgi:hypothetical protein